MFSKNVIVAAVFALSLTSSIPALSQAPSAPAAAEAKPAPGVLHRADLDALIPPSVFFKGQSATVQLRNSGGVRFAGGGVMFAVKVDTSGYSTSVQERYQDYLVTEVPLRFGEGAAEKTLAPGAYGIGFTPADGFLVMDVGAHTLFSLPVSTDAPMRRPTPLQVVAHDAGFRLYSGRTYISFSAAPAGN
jgi:hypothetical protein